MVKISQKLCDQCGTCVSLCPPDAFRLSSDSLAVIDSICDSCGICVPICPVAALSMGLALVKNKDIK